MDQLVDRDIKVDDVKTKPQRVAFAKSLPKHIVVHLPKTAGNGPSVGKAKAGRAAKGRATRTTAGPRKTLVPPGCKLNVTDTRAAQIEQELRRLPIENLPNAASVLVRVFLELSVDAYLKRNAGLAVGGNPPKLVSKIKVILSELARTQHLDADQVKVLRRMTDRATFMSLNITELNDFIHSSHGFPSPTDLRAGWDTWQPFLAAMWPVT